MRLCSIASGSSGNCIYAGSDTTSVLVDAGISCKRIEQGLNAIGLSGAEMAAVLVTHEHSDHIRGLGVLARKREFPSTLPGRHMRLFWPVRLWEKYPMDSITKFCRIVRWRSGI